MAQQKIRRANAVDEQMAETTGTDDPGAMLAEIDAKIGVPPSPLVVNGQEYHYSQQVGHLLRKAYQRHTAIFQQICIDPHLTSMQLAVLCALSTQGSDSLTNLGRATAVDPATMRGIVERLKARGFVDLSPDPHDGRKVIVLLTAQGRDMVDRMLPYSFEITKRTLEGLSVAEQVALNYLLTKISD